MKKFRLFFKDLNAWEGSEPRIMKETQIRSGFDKLYLENHFLVVEVFCLTDPLSLCVQTYLLDLGIILPPTG